MIFLKGKRLITYYFFICFIVISIFSIPIYAQQNDVGSYLESIVLYNFEDANEWLPITEAGQFMFFGTRTNKNGVEITYPSIRTFTNKPYSLGSQSNSSTNSLAVTVLFDRSSYNFFDLVPTEQKDIEGIPDVFSIWVWGGNYNYTMEIILSDYLGYTHTLSLGSLYYKGWKKLDASMPRTIKIESRYAPSQKEIRFLNFRFWSKPEERSKTFTVLLDYFTVLTDTFENFYDGSDVEQALMEEESGAASSSDSETESSEEETTVTQ